MELDLIYNFVIAWNILLHMEYRLPWCYSLVLFYTLQMSLNLESLAVLIYTCFKSNNSAVLTPSAILLNYAVNYQILIPFWCSLQWNKLILPTLFISCLFSLLSGTLLVFLLLLICSVNVFVFLIIGFIWAGMFSLLV